MQELEFGPNIRQQLQDCAWVHTHYSMLAGQFPNEWIVVRQGHIVFHGKHVDKRLFLNDFVTFIDDGCGIF